MSLHDVMPCPPGYQRLMDGQLGFAPNTCPSNDPAGSPGYWIWRGFLYRNGCLHGTVERYWFDRDLSAWWVDYYPLTNES